MPEIYQINVVSCVKLPAIRNSSDIITVNSLWGVGREKLLGLEAYVRRIYSRPIGVGISILVAENDDDDDADDCLCKGSSP